MDIKQPLVHSLLLSFLLVTACSSSGSDSQEPVSDAVNPEPTVENVEPSEPAATNDAPPSSTSSSSFQTFSYEPGGFEIDTPVTLERRVMEPIPTEVGNVERHEFMGEDRTSSYLVAYTDFPSEFIGLFTLDSFLDDERDAIIQNLDGTLRSDEPISLDGHSGRALVIEIKDSGSTFRLDVHMFLVDNRLYKAMVLVSPNWQEQPAETAEFLESFRLL